MASEGTVSGISRGFRFWSSQQAARLDGGRDRASWTTQSSHSPGDLLLSLRDLNFKASLTDIPDCPRCGSGLEETAEHSFSYWEWVRPFWDHVGEWTVRIEPKQLVLFDVGYVVDNVLPPFHVEKHVVFLAILAVARMVMWTTRNKGLYDDANFFSSWSGFVFSASAEGQNPMR